MKNISETEYIQALDIIKKYEEQLAVKDFNLESIKFLKLKKGDSVKYIGGSNAKLTIGGTYKLKEKPRLFRYRIRKNTVKLNINNDSGNNTNVSCEYFKFL